MSERLNRVEFVIKKYRLGERTVVDHVQDGAALGEGLLLDREALDQFVASDPSGNLKYLDWMLFQAGGGQVAMEKSIALWSGQNADDPNSLRNQCHGDFIGEQCRGYEDDAGYHPPVSLPQAELAWMSIEERSRFMFLMGDQDVASEDGFGFYRHWPDPKKRYEKIVNVIRLWHAAQPKLLAQNQRLERWKRLKPWPRADYSAEDDAFMLKCQETPPAQAVVLDLYAGWKPKEYSQAGAVYKNMSDMLHALAEVRTMQVLRDVRFDKIYEDDRVSAICPLTIGASIKFGISKWCVCNRTEFERVFSSGSDDGNWSRYNAKGPLVFLIWKVPMPPYLHRMALHLPMEHLEQIGRAYFSGIRWVDCQNASMGTNADDVRSRIAMEHLRDSLFQVETHSEDERSCETLFNLWGGRLPGRAWTSAETAKQIRSSLASALRAVAKWVPSFKPERVITDYMTNLGE